MILEASQLRMLNEEEYVKLLAANIIAQEQEVLSRYNQWMQETGKKGGRRFERNDEFLTANKRFLFGLGKEIRYGTPDVPTYVGNFWQWDKGSGNMIVDHERVQDYASQYYQGMMTGMNATMLSPDHASVALPTDYEQLFNNTPGDGSGDVIQHNVYGFDYDGLDLSNPKSQLAISELNNLYTMFNQMDPSDYDVMLGDKGSSRPEDFDAGSFLRNKNFRSRKINQGSNKAFAKDHRQALQLLSTLQDELKREAVQKSGTAQFALEYRENIANSEYGSYVLRLSPEYAKKFKGESGIMKDNAEFAESNSVTFYFKKSGDNSNYKTMNKAFDDIKILTDINGTFNQEVSGGGQYWFTKNSNGQYVANIILHKFDPETGQMINDQETKRQIVVDPTVTNMTNLATQLDNTLKNAAESNFGDQSIYKQNYTGQ